ncbi:vitamin K epoxide reductase family protein [Blastococcus goldschmidtiae]|uniref:Vitamin K epoxide reductase family protein n=1 Tax=Blastococcus goldschmidtiae TaxID=3075546 RepID=A0ABU2K766_9ACTN|nr:vitamin K epoxide reductase family protein [Blastococcus sp. DSM 46792]MDT0276036.1 vitamin K epoxide reductase family protein [Blastococcus sp. DSM 46792]
MSDTAVADRPVATEARGGGGRGLAVWLLVGGLLGFVAALVLAVEKYALLADPSYVPTCSLNPILSCGSIMASPQAEAFGFPNPLLGVAGFPVVATTGAVLLAGGRLAEWFWASLQAGVTAGVAFVHWLMFASLYRIEALCPYCMVVWAVTIPLFTAVTLRNLTAWAPRLPAGVNAAIALVRTRHSVLLTAWFLLIVAAITQRFWLYWSTLVG